MVCNTVSSCQLNGKSHPRLTTVHTESNSPRQGGDDPNRAPGLRRALRTRPRGTPHGADSPNLVPAMKGAADHFDAFCPADGCPIFVGRNAPGKRELTFGPLARVGTCGSMPADTRLTCGRAPRKGGNLRA